MYRVSLVVAWLCLVCANTAHASTADLTQQDICDRAEIVVIGKVTNVDPEWSGNIITSDVTFAVERVIHGPSLSTIVTFVLGGEINGVRYGAGSMPSFEDGERYLLLLHPRQGQPATILGAGQGAVRLNAFATLPTQSKLVAIWNEKCQ